MVRLCGLADEITRSRAIAGAEAEFFSNLLDPVTTNGSELLFQGIVGRPAKLLHGIGGAARPAAQVDAASEPLHLERALTLQTLRGSSCHRVLAC